MVEKIQIVVFLAHLLGLPLRSEGVEGSCVQPKGLPIGMINIRFSAKITDKLNLTISFMLLLCCFGLICRSSDLICRIWIGADMDTFSLIGIGNFEHGPRPDFLFI